MDSRLPDGWKPISVSIKDAIALTSIGMTTMYALIKEGKLKTVKVKRRTLVLYESIESLMAERTCDARRE